MTMQLDFAMPTETFLSIGPTNAKAERISITKGFSCVISTISLCVWAGKILETFLSHSLQNNKKNEIIKFCRAFIESVNDSSEISIFVATSLLCYLSRHKQSGFEGKKNKHLHLTRTENKRLRGVWKTRIANSEQSRIANSEY